MFFVFVFCLMVVMPTILGSIAILTAHQHRMAALRLEASKADDGRTAALERQVAELTALVHEQTIALDSLVGRARMEPIPERVGRSG